MSTKSKSIIQLKKDGSQRWPNFQQWWEALFWVYLTFAFLFAFALAGSFFPYAKVVQEGHPWLPRKKCPGCILCGMTRSFCAMSAGHWVEAAAWNRGGPALYLVGWLWVGGSLAVLFCLPRTQDDLGSQ